MGPAEGHIAITGFMGVGKSTVGRLLAGALGRPFVDVDERVEERLGRTIVDCFRAGDEALFRGQEAEATRDALRGPPSVISLGGGALLRPDTMALVLERSLLICLEVPWSEMRGWIVEHAATRPLLQDRSLEEIHELYVSRLATYRRAHLVVEVPRTSPEAAAEIVLGRLEAAGGK